MKSQWIFFTVALGAATSFAMPEAGVYTKPSFETYQPIVERMPFGAVPDPSSIPAVTTADELKIKNEKEALAKQIHMSAVNNMMDGSTAIGFTDLSAKPPVNYYLRVGDSEGGWTVLAADSDEETAKIEKDGVEIDLKFGKGLIETPTAPRPGLAAANQAVAAANQLNRQPAATIGVAPTSGERPLPPGLVKRERPEPPAVSTTGSAPNQSYSELVKKREQEKKAREEAAERKQIETMKKISDAAVKDAIRKKEEADAEAAQAQQAEFDDVDPIDE